MIYENWDQIVINCTRHDMTYVDVRRMSLYQLSRAHVPGWVVRFNDDHKPKTTRRTEKEYSQAMVDSVINNDPGSTQRILDQVDNDEEQLKLYGRDFINALIRKANGTL